MLVTYEFKKDNAGVEGRPKLEKWTVEPKVLNNLEEYLAELDDLRRTREVLEKMIQEEVRNSLLKLAGLPVQSNENARKRRRNAAWNDLVPVEERRARLDDRINRGLARAKKKYEENGKLIQQMESIIYRCLARK